MARPVTAEAFRAALTSVPILPSITTDDASTARFLGDALAAGRMRCVEITLRTPASFAAIEALRDCTELLVGAGSVITVEQVDRCTDAGAGFIVSPGLDEAVVGRALELGLAVLPGAATATEIQHALRMGLSAIKFFPADHLGGIAGVQAMSAPFPGLGFVPSGGIRVHDIAGYLEQQSVLAVSGAWMATRELIDDRGWASITDRCLRSVEAAEGSAR